MNTFIGMSGKSDSSSSTRSIFLLIASATAVVLLNRGVLASFERITKLFESAVPSRVNDHFAQAKQMFCPNTTAFFGAFFGAQSAASRMGPVMMMDSVGENFLHLPVAYGIEEW